MKDKIKITSFTLHVLAMAFMLCDHLWATIVPGNEWLTCIGRLAFPIFAFMIVEGYFHTKDLTKYKKRLFVFALISEIPFNLMNSGSLFYPLHQNVLWTFLIAILLIQWNERAKEKNKVWTRIWVGVVSVIAATILGIIGFVDYYNYGIYMVLVFYFLRGKKWWNYVLQFIAMYYINIEMMGGLVYEFEMFGRMVVLHQQGLALLSLIPIWLYNGEQGPYNKVIKNIYYWFYPVHALILALIMMML